MKKVERGKITWQAAIVLGVLSLIITFIGFLFYETIWGNIVAELFRKRTHIYSQINAILYVGLFVIFGTVLLVNMVVFREFKKEPKFIANLLSLILTALSLLVIGFIATRFLLPELTILEVLGQLPYYFAYLSVYILPSPEWFWVLALGIYHASLIVTSHELYVQKTVNFRKAQKRHNKTEQTYSSRIIKNPPVSKKKKRQS